MRCHMKVDKVVSGAEAASLLRRLADGLEHGKLTVGGTTIQVEHSVELSEILDVDGESVAFELKATYANRVESRTINDDYKEDAPDEAREPRESLKNLKKKMAKSLKDLMEAMNEGKLPRQNLVADWCANADLMMTLLNRGQEHFHPFRDKCRELLQSVEKRQLNSAKDAAEALNQMRKDCHSRYK
jgi:XXXCH domain-containing protein